jgi:hypothetical protein
MKNKILENARDVYKNRETEYYLETIRKTADELERSLKQQEKERKLLELYRKTTLQGKYEDVLMIAKLEKELEEELK